MDVMGSAYQPSETSRMGSETRPLNKKQQANKEFLSVQRRAPGHCKRPVSCIFFEGKVP